MSDAHQQKILIIDDEKDVHYSFQRVLQREGLEFLTAESAEEGIRLAKASEPDVIVMDIRMGQKNGLDALREIRRQNPRQMVIMMTAYGTSQTAIEAMKLGAFDYILKPFEIEPLKLLIGKALEAARLQKEEPRSLPVKMSPADLKQTIVGNSPPMQEIYKLIGQVAPSNATVLITGNSGTGKEMVARAIHSNSLRAQGVFVAMNCAAIPDKLLESELFGHEKGSFTGAMNQRIGKFEQCDGGTLFLDEIGEMPLSTQAKFLRVLQEGEFSRLGNNESIKTDVRFIAATNRDLWRSVEKKEFREDLFYRLNVVRISLPTLRDRISDLPLLVDYFINKYRQKHPNAPGKIAEEALTLLRSYPWPGNVRELENCVQRAMVLASGASILPDNLPEEVLAWSSGGGGGNSGGGAIHKVYEEAKTQTALKPMDYVMQQLIDCALKESGGDSAVAAKLLGLTKAAFTALEKKARK